MTEAARVREERGIEVGRDVRGDGCVERAQQGIHNLPRGARDGIDEVDRAESLTADVMIDVHDIARLLHERAFLAEPRHRRAIEREQRVERRRRLLEHLVSRQIVQQPWHGSGRHRVDPFARVSHRQCESQGGSEAVGVCILVRQAADVVALVDDARDLAHHVLEPGPLRCGHRHGAGSSSGLASSGDAPRSRSIALMCTLYAIDSSSSKWRRGMKRRFSSRLPNWARTKPSAWRMAVTTACRSASSPTALTMTRASRRSDVTRTLLTDASRTRGSFISRIISALISSRSCSATRSRRGGRAEWRRDSGRLVDLDLLDMTITDAGSGVLLFYGVRFDQVALGEVVEIAQSDAAIVAASHLAHIILEALEVGDAAARDLAGPTYHATGRA